jgi:predicted HTH transcriptional regulator
MAKRKTQNEKMELLERKYERKIAKTIKAYGNRTMGELWEALDKLKEEMRKEVEKIADRGSNMDTEDVVRDER